MKPSTYIPSIYVLNALAKPHALEHLPADLGSHKADVAVISETMFKDNHIDSFISIPGYNARYISGYALPPVMINTSASAVWLQPPELTTTLPPHSTTDVTCITESDNNAFIAEHELSFKLSTNERVMSPPRYASSPLISHATCHPLDNQQIPLLTTDPDDDLPMGDHDEFHSSDVSLTVASNNTVMSDEILLSPDMPQSPDSKPMSLSSSDYCIETLFNNDVFDRSDSFHTEPCLTNFAINKPPAKAKKKITFIFRSFGHVTYEEVFVLKLMKLQKLYSLIKLI